MSKRENYIRLTLSDSEKKAIEKQAAKDGARTAEWCRAKLMTAVALEKLQVKMEG